MNAGGRDGGGGGDFRGRVSEVCEERHDKKTEDRHD